MQAMPALPGQREQALSSGATPENEIFRLGNNWDVASVGAQKNSCIDVCVAGSKACTGFVF
jgi:hypothetical protein